MVCSVRLIWVEFSLNIGPGDPKRLNLPGFFKVAASNFCLNMRRRADLAALLGHFWSRPDACLLGEKVSSAAKHWEDDSI